MLCLGHGLGQTAIVGTSGLARANRSVRVRGTAHLFASLAIPFYLASGGASRACGSIRCPTARPFCAGRPPARNIESSGGFRTVGCSGVFRTLEFVRVVMFSTTKNWRFSALGFVFSSRAWCSRGLSESLRFFGSLDLLPIVGGLVFRVSIRKPEQVRLSPLRITCAPGLSYFYKAQRDHLSYCRTNGMAMNAIPFEIVVGYGQLSIVGAAVIRHFDFNAVQHAATR